MGTFYAVDTWWGCINRYTEGAALWLLLEKVEIHTPY